MAKHATGVGDHAKRLLRTRRFWAGLLLGCAFLFAFDHLQELARSAVDAATVYRRVVTSGFKPLYPRRTSIIQIRHTDEHADEPMEVTLVNVCQQRLFMSRLIDALAEHPPSVVVIDKVFSPDSCPSQKEGTQDLQRAIQRLLSKGSTVVIGVDIDAHKRLLPTVDFSSVDGGSQVTKASIRFEEDVRKTVFVWDQFYDAEGKSTKINTLSFAAALASIPHLLEVNPRLQRFYSEDVAPYVAFLPPKAFTPFTFSAIKVLCGPQADSKADWRTCPRPDDKAIDELSKRIVVIGEDTLGVDQHNTVIGNVPGLWLHANYIEAILDDDLFQPLPEWVSWIIGFAVFFLVELILSIGPVRWRGGLAIGTVLLAYAVCYLIVRLTGFYVNPGLGLVALIFSRIAAGIRSWLMPKEAEASVPTL